MEKGCGGWRPKLEEQGMNPTGFLILAHIKTSGAVTVVVAAVSLMTRAGKGGCGAPEQTGQVPEKGPGSLFIKMVFSK